MDGQGTVRSAPLWFDSVSYGPASSGRVGCVLVRIGGLEYGKHAFAAGGCGKGPKPAGEVRLHKVKTATLRPCDQVRFLTPAPVCGVIRVPRATMGFRGASNAEVRIGLVEYGQAGSRSAWCSMVGKGLDGYGMVRYGATGSGRARHSSDGSGSHWHD